MIIEDVSGDVQGSVRSCFRYCTPHSPQPLLMGWGAISFDGRTSLVVLRGTLNAQRCVDVILRTVLLPFFLLHLGLIFQKGKIHAERVAMNCLTACQTLSWPAKYLFNQACLGYDEKATEIYQGMLMILPNYLSKFGEKYLRKPSGWFITLCHTVW
ncbi:uncharacterized protein TNCV_4412541 [Trichonephila clavipes]|nr:uncharacterized protein TNCV_4412541 [Trichonephila clavipes]